MTAHLGRLVYDAASNDEPYPMDGGGLRPLFRGLQVVWIFSILSVFVSASVRIAGRRPAVTYAVHRVRGAHLQHLMVLVVPVVYLAPHLFYQSNPRHIVVAYLAMALTAMYATGVVRPRVQDRRADASR